MNIFFYIFFITIYAVHPFAFSQEAGKIPLDQEPMIDTASQFVP